MKERKGERKKKPRDSLYTGSVRLYRRLMQTSCDFHLYHRTPVRQAVFQSGFSCEACLTLGNGSRLRTTGKTERSRRALASRQAGRRDVQPNMQHPVVTQLCSIKARPFIKSYDERQLTDNRQKSWRGVGIGPRPGTEVLSRV